MAAGSAIHVNLINRNVKVIVAGISPDIVSD